MENLYIYYRFHLLGASNAFRLAFSYISKCLTSQNLIEVISFESNAFNEF